VVVYIVERVILVNKKGFTLVEILAVIVVLSLVITVVATKGFGAFDNAKNKIDKMNEDAIVEAAEIIKIDIEHCDYDINSDLLDLFDVNNCDELTNGLSSTNGINITLDKMLEKEYITGKSIEDIEDVYLYTINYKKVGNEIKYSEPIKEEKKAYLVNSFLSNILTSFGITKTDIIEIHFVKYVDEDKDKNLKEVSTNTIKSNMKVYSWIKEVDGKIKLYIGSEGKIYAPESSNQIFYNYTVLEKIKFDNFDTSNVISMTDMFRECIALKELDLSSFDTSEVTSMYTMFYNCKSLKKLDLSSFNTENVTSMLWMFGYCTSLEELDLSSFKTDSVTDMSYMFYYNNKLKKLNLSSFNTEIVENMGNMFGYCRSLEELELSSKFNTKEVTDMQNMFYYNEKLKELDLSSFNTENVTNMSSMFRDCTSLEKLDLSSFNTEKVTNMSRMFQNNRFKELNISGFDTKSVTNSQYMFYGASIGNICYNQSTTSNISSLIPTTAKLECN